MPSPQLKFDGIQSLLEQVLRYKSVYCRRFGNILFVNSLFLDVAVSRRTFWLCIQPQLITRTHFHFGGYPGVFTPVHVKPFECVKQILLFLKPQLLIIEHGSYSEFNPTILSELTNVSTRKIQLEIENGNSSVHVLNHLWESLDELCCDVDLLTKIDVLRVRPFDKLQIDNISTNEQLTSILSQPTKQLQMKFEPDCESVELDNNAEQSLSKYRSSVTKTCQLNFVHVLDFNQMLTIVRRVVTTHPQLEHLGIVCFFFLGDCHTDNEFIGKVVNKHDLYTKLVELIKAICQKLPRLKVDLDFRARAATLPFEEEPTNWKQMLMARNNFANVQFEEEDECESNLFLTNDTTSTKTKFSVLFYTINVE